MTLDLNCDMGELQDGASEPRLMRWITSANVACGGHAGDAFTMERTIRLALAAGVAVGAHPGYPDRANFGRVVLPMNSAEIADTVHAQVSALAAAAARMGSEVRHVKPHGALYNMAAKDEAVAQAIARGVARWNPGAVLVGLAGSRMLAAWREMGFTAAAEGFADRAYEPDGSLRSRREPDALIADPAAAARQAVRLAPSVQTICIHSDTQGAAAIAAAVRAGLEAAGIQLAPLG